MDATPIRLLLTRPQAASERVMADLRAMGAPAFDPVISPALKMIPVDALPDSGAASGLVFTSANGVRAWVAMGGRCDLPAYAVGKGTASTARQAGFDVWTAGGDADALTDGLLRLGPAGPLLHVHGRHTRGNVAQRLTDAGLPCAGFVAYDQQEQPPRQAALRILGEKRPVVVPLYSPRSAATVGSWPVKAPLLVAAMSQAVANACESAHIKEMAIAARPESASMLDCVAGLLVHAAEINASDWHT